MEFGSMIKRSWTITWRYKALWVLGIFAGISGCQPGGGGNGGGGSSSGNGSGFSNDMSTFSRAEMARFVEQMQSWLPALVALAFMFFAIWILWSILGVAARGGLVTGVNEVEQGRTQPLRALWRAGFGRFWTLIGLEILLKLPILAVSLFIIVGLIAAFWGVIAGAGAGGLDGGQALAGVVAPVCGALGIGLPVLFVMSLVLGTMYLIALRYVMLGGQRATEAAGNSWRFIRARFKDTALMYVISAGLNLAASFVVAIPIVIVVIAIAIPTAFSAASGDMTMIIPAVTLGIIVLSIVSMFYTGVWGTYSSALWTIFFRKVTGMEAPPVVYAPPSQPVIGYQPPVQTAPPMYQPPAQPESPAQQQPFEPPAPDA